MTSGEAIIMLGDEATGEVSVFIVNGVEEAALISLGLVIGIGCVFCGVVSNDLLTRVLSDEVKSNVDCDCLT